MAPTQFSPQGQFRSVFTVLAASLATTVIAVAGCMPSDAISFSDASVTPASGGATVPGSGGSSSGGAPGSGGAASGGAPGSGGARTGGAMGSGGASGTGGRGTGGAATGGAATGGAGTGSGGRGGGMGAGTGGSMGGGGSTAATFSAVATILAASCGTGTCHQGGAHVDLRNTAGLHGRIVSQMISGSGSDMACRTKTYIVPNSTANSVISQMIKAAVTGCGARMPDGCTTSGNPRACLTTAQIATIDAWIMAGAPM